jgi:hypothetical protein
MGGLASQPSGIRHVLCVLPHEGHERLHRGSESHREDVQEDRERGHKNHDRLGQSTVTDVMIETVAANTTTLSGLEIPLGMTGVIISLSAQPGRAVPTS